MTEVKVRVAGETVPSLVSEEETAVVTSAVGSAVKTTVKVAVAPASVVLPLMAETVKAEVSLSVLVAETSDGLRVL